jgi:hypothetical protein
LKGNVALPHCGAVRCFACHGIVELPPGQRVGRREACPRCDADLHACRNCRHQDPRAARGCREPQAEWVRDPERANLCDWFSPAEPSASVPGEGPGARRAARAALDALFKKP